MLVPGVNVYLLRRGLATRARLSLSDAANASLTILRAAASLSGVARLMSGLLFSAGTIRGTMRGCAETSGEIPALRKCSSLTFLEATNSPEFQSSGEPVPGTPGRRSDATPRLAKAEFPPLT
jgi:hypothetical protein